jgi:hypothetical protein
MWQRRCALEDSGERSRSRQIRSLIVTLSNRACLIRLVRDEALDFATSPPDLRQAVDAAKPARSADPLRPDRSWPLAQGNYRIATDEEIADGKKLIPSGITADGSISREHRCH